MAAAASGMASAVAVAVAVATGAAGKGPAMAAAAGTTPAEGPLVAAAVAAGMVVVAADQLPLPCGGPLATLQQTQIILKHCEEDNHENCIMPADGFLLCASDPRADLKLVASGHPKEKKEMT